MIAFSGATPDAASRATTPPHLADLYRALFDTTAERDACVDERPVRLWASGDLHLLDQHACLLLARACYTPVFVLREAAPAHLCARVAAHFISPEPGEPDARLYEHFAPARGTGIDYAPGVLLARVLNVHRRAQLWHDYLTSRDRALPDIAAGATLDGKFPHLPLGFVLGADLFNRGEFYRAHEEWESLWMRLGANAERSLAQGLIQLAGAHIHRIKNRAHESRKLLRSATRHLNDARPLDWIDTDALLVESEVVFGSDAAAPIPLPSVTLLDTTPNVPRKHR